MSMPNNQKVCVNLLKHLPVYEEWRKAEYISNFIVCTGITKLDVKNYWKKSH